MNWNELQQQRAARWRTNDDPLRTGNAAAEFVANCGLCLMYPQRGMLLPTLIGAVAGTDKGLLEAKQAFSHGSSLVAQAISADITNGKLIYRWPLRGAIAENELLISLEAFPFFFALAADHKGK